jgi:hypothetical protein
MIVLGLVSPGCSVVGIAVETVVYKTREHVQEYEERSRNRKWAAAAWCDVRRANPEASYSDSFACGFRTGYADYLYAGEPGTPPALPPRQYRALAYQTPAGYRSIEDWFAGYRYGVEVARADGYRELITGPTSLPGPQLPVAQPQPPPTRPVPEPGSEQLHYPRQAQLPALRPEPRSTGTVREPAPRRLPETAQIHISAPQPESEAVGATPEAEAEQLPSIGELSAPAAPATAPQEPQPAPQRTDE